MSSCSTVSISSDALERADNLVVPRAKNPCKVVVAMSGGVDSSVAAWLLKEAGHEVIGVSLRLAPDDSNSLSGRQGRCCSVDDMTDARQVCDKLGIPFYAIDSRERFKNVVFDPFVKAYKNGETPIPCLACNHDVKFGSLYQTAKSFGAKLATGHYARIVDYAGVKAFARPDDRNRDQTYYLYGTDAEVLANLELPLGELDKPLIRALAKRIGMAVHSKPDSHEICFVPDGNHARVVEKAAGALPKGELRNLDGEKIADHSGVHHFTVGQRRGIGVGIGERAYVVDIDPASNVVTLGSKDALMCTQIEAKSLKTPVALSLWPARVKVQVRARHEPVLAMWKSLENGNIQFQFEAPVGAVSLGQAAVAYDGDVMLGGGIINARLDGIRPRRSVINTVESPR